MIVNRFDYRMLDEVNGYGVGWQLLTTGQYDMEEIDLGVRKGKQKKKRKKGKHSSAVDDADLRTDRDLDALHKQGGQTVGAARNKRKGRGNARQRQFEKRAARESSLKL